MMNDRVVCVTLMTGYKNGSCIYMFLAQNVEGKITFLEVKFRKLLTLKLKQRNGQ